MVEVDEERSLRPTALRKRSLSAIFVSLVLCSLFLEGDCSRFVCFSDACCDVSIEFESVQPHTRRQRGMCTRFGYELGRDRSTMKRKKI